MTVTLNSYGATNNGNGYTSHSITYTQRNDTSVVIDEATFKLYFAENYSVPQYGFFDRIFPGQSLQRSYTWTEVTSYTPQVLEYDQETFFSSQPISGSLQWALPVLAPAPAPAPAPSPVAAWRVSGVVTSVDSELAQTYSVGTSVTVTFSYALAGPPVSTFVSGVNRSLLSLSAQVGGVQATKVATQSLYSLLNDAPYDEFILGYIGLDGAPVAGLDPPEFYLGLVDFTATRFDSNVFPPTEIGNLSCNSRCMFISYEDRAANASRRVYISFGAASVVVSP